ncbi:MAG: hypothetical protein KatS3mg031_2341 [Chitinophagales bacterium]|nr:MAG: hypothetical protein KatS3mg031_2341 [Chitinophagales bacterium]
MRKYLHSFLFRFQSAAVGKSVVKWLCVIFSLYVIFLVWLFRHSRFVAEPSSELFKLYDHQDFAIPVLRFSHQIPQLVPVLLSKLGFSLPVIANAYNFSEAVIWIVPIALGLVSRKLHYCFIAIFSIFIMFQVNFNTLGMEITYTAFFVLTWIWCLEHIKNKALWLLVHIGLSFYIIYSHPLTMLAWFMAGGVYFLFYCQPAFKHSLLFIAVEILPAVWLLFQRATSLSDYDVGKLEKIWSTGDTASDDTHFRLHFLLLLVAVWLIIHWYRKSHYKKIIAFYFVLILYYIGIQALNYELFWDSYKLMFPLNLFIVAAAGFEIYHSFGNNFFNKSFFLTFLVIALLHGSLKFYSNSRQRTGQREFILNQIRRLQTVDGQKFYMHRLCGAVHPLWCPTGCASESLFLSLYYDFPKPVSLVVADEEAIVRLKALPENKIYFNSGWTDEITGLNKGIIKDQPYRLLSCDYEFR